MPSFNMNEFFGEPAGYVFDPPSCPANRFGEPIDIFNVPAEFIVHSPARKADDSSGMLVWMAFSERAHDGNFVDYVETDFITFDATDALFGVVEELGRKPEDPRIERMRQAFCDRVRSCKGPDGDECWALGKQAVEQVLRETLLEPPSGSLS